MQEVRGSTPLGSTTTTLQLKKPFTQQCVSFVYGDPRHGAVMDSGQGETFYDEAEEAGALCAGNDARDVSSTDYLALRG